MRSIAASLAAGRRRRTVGFTLVELLIVLGVIVMLTSVFVVTYPMLRFKAQIKAAEGDLKEIDMGIGSYRAKWNSLPPSGNLALVAALREGDPNGPPFAALKAARLKVIALSLSGGLAEDETSLDVSPAEQLPMFPPLEGEIPEVKQFGACKIDEEWITFSRVENGTLSGCRRGRFGTLPAEHAGGSKVLIYEFSDPWGVPYAYTQARDYGDPRSGQVITQTGYCKGSPCDPRFSPAGGDQCYENCGEYQIISAGPNRRFFRRDTSGEPVDPEDEDDDIKNWVTGR